MFFLSIMVSFLLLGAGRMPRRCAATFDFTKLCKISESMNRIDAKNISARLRATHTVTGIHFQRLHWPSDFPRNWQIGWILKDLQVLFPSWHFEKMTKNNLFSLILLFSRVTMRDHHRKYFTSWEANKRVTVPISKTWCPSRFLFAKIVLQEKRSWHSLLCD